MKHTHYRLANLARFRTPRPARTALLRLLTRDPLGVFPREGLLCIVHELREILLLIYLPYAILDDPDFMRGKGVRGG